MEKDFYVDIVYSFQWIVDVYWLWLWLWLLLLLLLLELLSFFYKKLFTHGSLPGATVVAEHH